MARRGQQEADRRFHALREASGYEANRIHELAANGQLTSHEVLSGPQNAEGWVQRSDALAAEQEARQEELRQQENEAQQKLESDAHTEFQKQALPLARDMVVAGLDPNEKSNDPQNPDDTLYENLLRQALNTEERRADIALTWRIDDPAEQARIAERVYTGAMVDAAAAIKQLAEARGIVQQNYARTSQWDRTTAVGQSMGGPDITPTPPIDEIWGRIVWKDS